MPKKKPIAKRLKNIFEDVKPEQAPAELKPAANKRAPTEKTERQSDLKPVASAKRSVELISQVKQTDSVMSLAFQAGQNSWATLQVQDETDQRKWSPDEQLLVKQVADQLSLALENARLFQETQSRAEELAVLNEMGRELSTKLEISSIAEVIYKYTSRLMDTGNFFLALYDEKKEEKTYPLVFEEGARIQLSPSMLGNRGFSDYIIRRKKAVFAPNDVLGHMQALGIEFVPLNEDETPSQCWLGVPLLIGERVLGVISVQNVQRPNVYDEHHRDILETIASQAAIAIENARLFEEISASQGQLSEALQIARIGYFEIDLQTQTITFTNELFSLLNTSAEREGGFQFPLEQAQQKFVLTEDISIAAQAVQDAINEHTGAGTRASEVRYRTSDGRVIWVSSIYKVERDAQGQPVKVAGSSQDITERKTNELIQAAITKISESALTSKTIHDLIRSVHEAIGNLLPARNLYVALYDPTTSIITFPYHADEYDDEWSPRKLGRGLTSYVIRTGRPLRTTPEIFADLEASGEVVSDGARSVDWLGVPLRLKQVVTGVLAIQTYGPPIRITEQHREILSILAAQVASAIERFLAEREIQKFKLGIDRSDNTVFITDIEGVIQYANPAFEKVYGFSPEEVIGKTPRIIKSGLISQEQYQHFWDILLSGGTVSSELVNKSKDGRLIPIAGTNSPILDEGGEIIGFLAVQQDITERKQAADALRESDARTRLILETAIDGFISIDSQSTIMEWNPQAAQIFGWPGEEAIGRNLADLIIPETYRSAHRGGVQHYLATGEGPVLNQRIEITGLHRDGHLFPIELAITSIPTTGGSTFTAFVRDITERKRSEAAIRRQNEYLGASAEISRLVTSTLDLNTIFTRTVNLVSERFGFYFAAIYNVEETGFNAILREATGEAGEKMKAQKYSVVVGSNSVVGKVADGAMPMLVNDTDLEPLYHPNPFLLDTRSEVAIPLRIGPRIVGVIDIQSTQTHAFTEDDLSVLQSLADQVAVAIDNARSYELLQQLIKDLREVDQLKSQFLANMSHELRTPLNSIIGFSRVILKGIDGPVTDMQQQDLTAIYNSGQHLLGLINDILDLARIEAGKMELNFEEVHLAEMTTSVMATAKGLVKEKPIHLLQRIPADMPTVRGDTMRVRQVLLNLISNASKFTDEGSIIVETLTQKGPTGKMEALINVIDTGPGISMEDQKKLFQAFSQVDGSATRKSGGSGLGLSICANLVQLHGGRISVHSEIGMGSTFWFTLPLYHQPLEEIPEGRKVVLAIDDDPQVIGLYERYLSSQGYYVVALTDPSKAKERVLEIKPYAITLDIMMPNKDGWTVLNDLKSDPATRGYPVIVCSIMEQADKGFSLGAADYLVKPILEEDLVHALTRLNKDGTIKEVLVIDDDPNDLRLIEKILSEHGQYKPILAEGGRKGWEAINRKPPHAIILDIFMPDMDGFAILEKLRENSMLRDIPVLVVSGGGLTNEQQKQIKDFGQRLITKGSLNEVELIESIESALRRIDQ